MKKKQTVFMHWVAKQTDLEVHKLQYLTGGLKSKTNIPAVSKVL